MLCEKCYKKQYGEKPLDILPAGKYKCELCNEEFDVK